MICRHWTELAGYCETPTDRTYLQGPRCAAHTPAALAGRPEVIPDPALTLDGLRAARGLVWGFNSNDTALNDTRARARGQRASGAQRRAAHG